MARKRTDNDNMDKYIPGGLPPMDDNFQPGGLPPMDDNTPVDSDISEVVRERLSKIETKPLVKTSIKVKPQSTRLEEIIKPVDEIIKTGEPIDNNLLIKPIDRTSVFDVSDILSNPIEIRKPTPEIIPADILGERDRARLFAEEDKRRRIEDERFEQFNLAVEEEFERRRLFEDEIRLMKEDFDIYLKKTFPEFVGDRKMKDSEMDSLKRKNEEERRLNEEKRKMIQQQKIQRMEFEKQRKFKEKEFQLNKLTKKEVPTFFEEEILIEQREKLSKYDELENLNDVQKTIRDIEQMEIRMGRPIIPHRDIIESEESDFDRNSYTDSKDILIKKMDKISPEEEEIKRRMLEELRFRLQPNENLEEDYISKKSKIRKTNLI